MPLCKNKLNGLPFDQPWYALKSVRHPFLKYTENATLACFSSAGDAQALPDTGYDVPTDASGESAAASTAAASICFFIFMRIFLLFLLSRAVQAAPRMRCGIYSCVFTERSSPFVLMTC